MFPAQALAEEMLARGWRVRLATDARGARYAAGFPPEVERRATPAATFAQGSLLTRVTAPFAIAAGVAATWADFRRERPACVAGFGGYPALPAHGGGGPAQGPHASSTSRTACSAGSTAASRRRSTWSPAASGRRRCPKGTRALHVGNPVRGAVLDREGATYLEPGDHADGAARHRRQPGRRASSRGSCRRRWGCSRPSSARRLRLSQQVRPEDMDLVRAAYERDGRWRPSCAPSSTTCRSGWRRRRSSISRAGASSIADISVIGRPAILVPYPHALDDHQAANAAGLVSAGGAFMIREEELTAEVLAGHIAAILGDPEGASAMARASRGQGRPDATEHLAALVEDLARQKRS